jgi:hypothetical protein
MAEDNTNDESGSGLRDQLETALAQKKVLEEQNGRLVVGNFISSKSNEFSLVEASDLAGVPEAQLAEKAAAIQAEKIASREAVVDSILTGKGFTGDELVAARTEFLSTGGDTSTADAYGRAAQLGGVGGQPIQVNPDDLSTNDKIRLGLSARK